ncbi:MAG: TetR/AcrR family transcriptional regulator [[Clostridium] innocuum]|nr:TetR/AcrR family transcriptional regulator [[Clostridium] innocuum]
MGKKGDETKKHIKEQAKLLFANKGFKEVTMKDICEATSLSRGGLYRHYDSTDQIFAEIISEFLDVQNNIFSESIEKGISASEILNEILNNYQLEMLDAKHSLSMAIYEYFSSKNIAENENILLKRYQLSFDYWDKLVNYGISRGEFKSVDTKGIIDLILFSYQGIRMYSQLMPIQKETPIRMIEQIKKLLLK